MGKPKLFNGTEWIEFDTVQEFEDHLRSISGTAPDVTDYLKNQEHEILGKEIVRELFVTLRQQNLTQAQEGDLIGRIYPVLNVLSHGFIRGARVLANNLSLAGQLTSGRKDYLIAKIDEALTKL